jgi:hypothetical protein
MADILNIPTTLLLGDGAGQHAVGSIGEYLAERIASRSIVNYATQLAPID